MTYTWVMPEPFRGAPTRTGRVILAVMGGPFVLTALCLFGSVVVGDDRPGEKLMMFIAGGVFASAGLLLWVPAFPTVVNRILAFDNRFVRELRRHFMPMVPGLMIFGMGMVPVLTAVGIIPNEDFFGETPPWVGGLAGGMFVVVGLFILTRPLVVKMSPALRKQVEGLFPLLIFTAMATISGWIAFAPGPRAFESGAANGILRYSWGGGSELLGRAAFGLGAVFLIVISVIGWWKYLRGRW